MNTGFFLWAVTCDTAHVKQRCSLSASSWLPGCSPRGTSAAVPPVPSCPREQDVGALKRFKLDGLVEKTYFLMSSCK